MTMHKASIQLCFQVASALKTFYYCCFSQFAHELSGFYFFRQTLFAMNSVPLYSLYTVEEDRINWLHAMCKNDKPNIVFKVFYRSLQFKKYPIGDACRHFDVSIDYTVNNEVQVNSSTIVN